MLENLGIAGSMLHSPEGKFPETYKKLWVSFSDQDNIGLSYLSGYWNGSMVTERFRHKVVVLPDGDGLCSIDDLDPDLISFAAGDAFYYHKMIEYLISIGYEAGKTLFGFPYDWRQSVRHPATLQRLHDLIHRLHETTTAPGGLDDAERQPVDIMTHSMGGLVMKAYVSKYLDDAAGILGKWVAIGTPWRGGGSVAYKAMISGYALDMTTIPYINWGLREDIAHALELNWPSPFELMPDLSHGPWWSSPELPTPLSGPPSITYQYKDKPISVEHTEEVRRLLTEINEDNVQSFDGKISVPNPMNQGDRKSVV